MIELFCPECKKGLFLVETDNGPLWKCGPCQGRALNIRLLEEISNTDLIKDILQRATLERKKSKKECPACSREMFKVTASKEMNHVELELCHLCYIIWFDRHDIESLPPVSIVDPRKKEEILVYDYQVPERFKRAADPLNRVRHMFFDPTEALELLLDLLNQKEKPKKKK
ncbi:MAG: hypothetical protein ACOYL6_00375 [Bacteriovoracaceae bacterium]